MQLEVKFGLEQPLKTFVNGAATQSDAEHLYEFFAVQIGEHCPRDIFYSQLAVQQINIHNVWILTYCNYYESIFKVRGSHPVAFFGNPVSLVCHDLWFPLTPRYTNIIKWLEPVRDSAPSAADAHYGRNLLAVAHRS